MNTHDSEWRAVVEKMFDRVWELLNPKGNPDEDDWKDWEEPAQVFAAIDRALSDGRLTLIDKEIHHIDGDPRNNELLTALKGVVRVADRKTAEFDTARAAIAKTEGN